MNLNLLNKLVKELKTENDELVKLESDKLDSVKKPIKQLAYEIYNIVDSLYPITNTLVMNIKHGNVEIEIHGINGLGSAIRVNKHFIITNNGIMANDYFYSHTYNELVIDYKLLLNIKPIVEAEAERILVEYNNDLENRKKKLA